MSVDVKMKDQCIDGVMAQQRERHHYSTASMSGGVSH